MIRSQEPRADPVISLYILSTRQQLTIPMKSRVILGRSSKIEADGTVHIDLTPFYGHQLGVSRRHVMLTCEGEKDVVVFDLASQNGTYVNGQQISSHTGYSINDGDELVLGSLSIRVYCGDKVPFADFPKRPFEPKRASSQHPETHTPLPYPPPDIRDTLETRPLQSLSEKDREKLIQR